MNRSSIGPRDYKFSCRCQAAPPEGFMNNYRHDDCRRPSIGMRRGLSTVLVATATLFMVGATGCGAQEPARRTARGQTAAPPHTYPAKNHAARPGDGSVF